MIQLYYQLVKPGIVYGNVMTAAAAFVFALHHAHYAVPSGGMAATAYAPLFFATVLGLGLSIAAACVINNIFDRDIDARMERTKRRALTSNELSVRNAWIYAFVLGAAGFSLLVLYTNRCAVLGALAGVLIYLFLYTPAKRVTAHSTVIGALAGAMPPVVGYTAVSGTIDGSALLLFLILVCWQMPHFFAIALYRLGDYQAAGLPVMPVRIGGRRTRFLMALYAFLFAASVLSLAEVAGLGLVYTIPVGLSSLGWVLLSLTGLSKDPHARYARAMFFYSLVLLLLFSVLLVFA